MSPIKSEREPADESPGWLTGQSSASASSPRVSPRISPRGAKGKRASAGQGKKVPWQECLRVIRQPPPETLETLEHKLEMIKALHATVGFSCFLQRQLRQVSTASETVVHSLLVLLRHSCSPDLERAAPKVRQDLQYDALGTLINATRFVDEDVNTVAAPGGSKDAGAVGAGGELGAWSWNEVARLLRGDIHISPERGVLDDIAARCARGRGGGSRLGGGER